MVGGREVGFVGDEKVVREGVGGGEEVDGVE